MDETGGGGEIDRAMLERWALAYIARYASSAETLRRVLRRRVLRLGPSPEAREAAAALIEALVRHYCATGLVDERAYAAAQARARHRCGASLRAIRAGLSARGVAQDDAAAAIALLSEEGPDPELAAAGAFARRRRLGPFRPNAEAARDIEDAQRDLGAFARAGFPRDVAEAVLACADPEALRALVREGR